MSSSAHSNFSFLKNKYPKLSKCAALAENCIYIDPHNSIIKLSIVCELICKEICKINNIALFAGNRRRSFKELTNLLKYKNILSKKDLKLFNKIIVYRNEAAHDYIEDIEIAIQIFAFLYGLSCNFYKSYIDYDYLFPDFIYPDDKLLLSKESSKNLHNIINAIQNHVLDPYADRQINYFINKKDFSNIDSKALKSAEDLLKNRIVPEIMPQTSYKFFNIYI